MEDEPQSGGPSTSGHADWTPTTSVSTPPPSEALRWLAAAVDDEVVAVEPLVGGTSSAVHLVEFVAHEPVVLRRYVLADWLAREPNIPEDEARVLAAVAELDIGVATPRLVALDATGDHGDVPALAMSVVPGSPDLSPADPYGWAEALAENLAAIHSHGAANELPTFRRWDDPSSPPPTWTDDPEMWRSARAIAATELPAHPQVLIHRDYHPNNVHWSAGKICGVVDWLNACAGPIAADLSHCRWNLALLDSPSLAEHFTDHYRSLTGYAEDVFLFDLSAVLSGPIGPITTYAWNDLGRSDLSHEVVHPRADEWLRWVLLRA